MKNNSKYDIMNLLRKRPLSWSAISSFRFSPEQWYNRYFLNEKQDESPEMAFGKSVALSIEDGTCKVPGLLAALQKKKEHGFKVVFNKIPLVGFADAFCDEKFRTLDEVKTGKKPWDQRRADDHEQLTMYALMNYITNKVRPEDVLFTLYWIPTEDRGDFTIGFVNPVRFYAFPTKRTMKDIIRFGADIKSIVKEMEEYIRKH